MKKRCMKRNRFMAMQEAVPGLRYRICDIRGGSKLNAHLCSMGILPHETFTVSNKVGGGPMTVSIKGSRLALGNKVTDKVMVREV